MSKMTERGSYEEVKSDTKSNILTTPKEGGSAKQHCSKLELAQDVCKLHAEAHR